MQYKVKVQDNSVAIIGWEEGTAGQVHSWIEQDGKYHIACFVNPSINKLDINTDEIERDASQFDYPTENSFKDKPLINSENWLEELKSLNIRYVLVTTPEQKDRYKQINMAKENGLKLIKAIHPSALIMNDAIIGDNVIMHAKSFVGYRSEISSGTIIDTNSQIDHHNVIKECVTINPGVVTAGNVTIEKFAKVHTGAIIINRKTIGENSILGAGTVIIKNVPANVTVVGVPGKIIKSSE
jgi:sugar O-acyltransferase (sialic acid O-acetyltransferase NeuD family)